MKDEVWLATQNCVLAPVCEDDRDDVFTLYQNKVVRKYLGGPVDRLTFDAGFDRTLKSDTSIDWTIRVKEGGMFAGTISIGKHHDGADVELSYQILPENWGKGIAFEVATAILELASKTLKLSSICAETQTANVASRRLLEKLGMSQHREVVRFDEKQVIYRKELKRRNP